MPAEELVRLQEAAQQRKPWKRWGPYLSERQWGTVREDYSADGNCWDYFSHDQARSRAYRWGEDGLLGISDEQCRLAFALALWNERDPILKERLFGLTGPAGNHGEDVKELYYYLDSTPTHSYLKALYKYPQATFPYQRLVEENQRRGKDALEFELVDTGVFDAGRYFDVLVEYAKASPASRSQIAVPSGRRSMCCRRSGTATRGTGGARATTSRPGPFCSRLVRRRSPPSTRHSAPTASGRISGPTGRRPGCSSRITSPT